MSSKAITQHYWDKQNQIVQAPKRADKPRDDQNQSFSEVYKKAKKRDRAVLTVIVIWFIILAFTQLGIADGWIHGPGYLADFM